MIEVQKSHKLEVELVYHGIWYNVPIPVSCFKNGCVCVCVGGGGGGLHVFGSSVLMNVHLAFCKLDPLISFRPPLLQHTYPRAFRQHTGPCYLSIVAHRP